jgi:hypothetical protein
MACVVRIAMLAVECGDCAAYGRRSYPSGAAWPGPLYEIGFPGGRRLLLREWEMMSGGG